MKKKQRFFVLPTIKLKNIINAFCILVSSGVLVFTILSSVNTNITSDFVSLILSMGTGSRYQTDKNITSEMLMLSVPTVSLVPKENKETKEDPVAPPSPSTPTPEPMVYISPPTKPVSYIDTDNLYINNLSGKNFDKEALLNKDLDLSLSDEPSVLILHTHTTESYTSSEKYSYSSTESGRTLDSKFNMISVGEVIYNYLTEHGINVIHDKTVNDYPSYSQSYSKSLKRAESYIKEYPSIKMVIDVHRDALGSGEKTLSSFDPSSAQVMLVIGTNSSGLEHPHWDTNLSFALKLQREMNSIYPSLARPINLRRERFNHHVAPYSFILEVGTNSNTLDEAKKAAEYFSLSLISLLKV